MKIETAYVDGLYDMFDQEPDPQENEDHAEEDQKQ